MSTQANLESLSDDRVPIIALDIPVIYEDEGQDEMGESVSHSESDRIVYLGLKSHFSDRTDIRVLSNLNVFYHPLDRGAYVSPDEMIVQSSASLNGLRSYRVGNDGPAPLVAIEVLSKRSYQQQDLGDKISVYAFMKVSEYILVDVTGEFLSQRLLLKRLSGPNTWIDEQDADGGITSSLGFRVVIEPDGLLRVLDAATGRKYLRANETEATRTILEQSFELEKQRAETEKQRAESEKQRADLAEQKAAIEAEARAALEAELRQLREEHKRRS